MNNLKYIFSRMGFLFVIGIMISYCCTDLYMMKVKMINHHAPTSMSDFVDFAIAPSSDKAKTLNGYIMFFKTISKIIPDAAAAQFFKGYCYYYLGDEARAIAAIKKAASIQKNQFWFYYDLGVIYYNRHDFAKAKEYLEKAKAGPINDTITFIYSAKTYPQIIEAAKKRGYDLEKGLIEAFRNAQDMLFVCNVGVRPTLDRHYELKIL